MDERAVMDFLFRMMTSCTYQNKLGERDVCLNVKVDRKTNQVEDEDDVGIAPKELLDLMTDMRGDLNHILSCF